MNKRDLSRTIFHDWKKFSTHMNYFKAQRVTSYSFIGREIHFDKIEPGIEAIVTIILQWVDFNHYATFDIKRINVVLVVFKIQRLFLSAAI